MNSKVKKLNLMHKDIRSLRRDFEELILPLIEKDIDIAIINEIFFRPKKKITIPVYPIIRNDLVNVGE